MREMKNSYTILVEKSEGMTLCGRPGKDKIKIKT
jgi:hypothetical protein